MKLQLFAGEAVYAAGWKTVMENYSILETEDSSGAERGIEAN